MADDKEGTRLRWQAGDEETGDAPRQHQQLTRTASNVSAGSARVQRRGSMDPALTLPIHYRSV
jgi:sodium/potassium-transporting ATPase subunit alpha